MNVGTIAFVLGFLGIGLTVLLLAMRGGPRGVREGLHTQSRGGRRFTTLLVWVLTIGFGAAIPALIIIGGESQAEQAGGVELSAKQTEGRELFAKNCGTCHQLKASSSTGRVGPNLDNLRPPKNLTLDAIAKGRARGAGQMPAELLDGEDAVNVAEYIVRVAGR